MKINYDTGGSMQPYFKDVVERIKYSITETARQVARETVKKGKDNVRAAGNFKGRWINAVGGKVLPENGTSLTPVIEFYYAIPYGVVFELGATIRPSRRKYLWIPVNDLATNKMNPTTGWSPRRYMAQGHRLQFVMSRSGTPVLIDTESKRVAFVGVTQVTIQKRFDLYNIFAQAAQDLADTYDVKGG